MKKQVIPCEKEILTPVQKLNEYIMTSLRTIEGLDLTRIPEAPQIDKLKAASRKFIERGLIVEEAKQLRLTRKGKLVADGIAAELFFDKEIPQIVD
ncbi:MAG: hypothetical protein E6H10_10620 [Bacteroidetes bacterium]|nr:MAG: hypothetical protein E6H10_10620 [Bacteroidota bacterium]